MNIKKYKEYIKEAFDYEEEPEDDDLVIIRWLDHNSCENSNFFILQNIIDVNHIILYDNLDHNVNYDMGFRDKLKYEILSKDQLENYIYNNKCGIYIFDREKDFYGSQNNKKYYWEDLPQEIKDQL